MPEIYPNQPHDNPLLRIMGELLLELQNRGHYIGGAEYIDVYPIDPQEPQDGYTWEWNILRPATPTQPGDRL